MTPTPRSVTALVAAALVLVVAAWVFLAQPFQPEPAQGGTGARVAGTTGAADVAPADGAPPSSRAGSPSSTPSRASTCRAGEPARLVIPALGVDAPFERIGLDPIAEPDTEGRRPLGNPKDRTRAGWYADGPRPGTGTGTVLTNGHTYRDNSAIFKEDFAERIAVGQLIHVRQRNGSTCSYSVSRVWREVDAARDYPRIVVSEHLYDFEGPERLFLTTCGGSWNSVTQNYDDISLLVATPVRRG